MTPDREELLIPREVVVVDEERTVPLRLTNLGKEEVRILRGSDVGTFHAVRAGRHDNEYEICESGEVLQSGRVATACSGPQNTENPANDPVPGLDANESDMSPKGKAELRELVSEYRDVFSQYPGDIGRTHVVEHRIDTGDATPRRQRPRRVPINLREQVEEQKQQMLRDGIIEESDSPWCSPVVLTRKKDGTYRFCVDMRSVNGVTRGLAHPLPRVDDALDSLSGARWYTTLDMATGYWQVGLAPEDREKTAFSTGRGLHQSRSWPWGSKTPVEHSSVSWSWFWQG